MTTLRDEDREWLAEFYRLTRRVRNELTLAEKAVLDEFEMEGGKCAQCGEISRWEEGILAEIYDTRNEGAPSRLVHWDCRLPTEDLA